MDIRTGYSNESHAFKAGEQVIQTALKGDTPADIVMVMAFCTSYLDQKIFVDGMASQLPPGTPIVGGTTVGVINNSIVSYNQPAAISLILTGGPIRAKVATATLNANNEKAAGMEIASKMGCPVNDQFLFLLYNMIKKERRHRTPPEMNSLLSILNGIESVNRAQTPIFGAGAIGDYNFSASTLFGSFGVATNQILGISFCGDFYYDYAVMHGCTPIDGVYHTITRNDGAIILELDNEPAMNVVNEIYGNRDWQRELPVKELTVGINLGDKYGPYQESNYINRLIAGPMLLDKGIITPEPDWQPGTEIQFMVRDNEQMITSTQKRSKALVQRIIKAGKKPQLGFYIDCAGRTSYFANSLQEEASIVQDIFNEHNIPLFGFYSGLEIAPFFNKSRGLEWTGVLIVLAEH
jgi:hypothetical protein